MAMELHRAIPFGRTLAEYRSISNLTAGDLHAKSSIFGAGSASFAAEMSAQGDRVTAIERVRGTKIQQRFNDCGVMKCRS